MQFRGEPPSLTLLLIPVRVLSRPLFLKSRPTWLVSGTLTDCPAWSLGECVSVMSFRGHVCRCPQAAHRLREFPEWTQTTSPRLWWALLLHLSTTVQPFWRALEAVSAKQVNVSCHLLPKPVAAVGNMLAYIRGDSGWPRDEALDEQGKGLLS